MSSWDNSAELPGTNSNFHLSAALEQCFENIEALEVVVELIAVELAVAVERMAVAVEWMTVAVHFCFYCLD